MMTDIIYMNGLVAARRTIYVCPICQEAINYYPPDVVGYCDCGYCTEEG
jgi:hypothetical protein